MKSTTVLLCFALLAGSALANVYFKEDFSSGIDSWVQSTAKSDLGKFTWSAGKNAADENKKGLQTSQDARFYAISKEFPESVENKDKDLAVQFTVKHEQDIDCGGGYMKLMPEFEQTKFEGETAYAIMFGPDICGFSKKIHFIINYKGKNHLWKKEPRAEGDTFTHAYSFVLHPDNTYEVRVDNKKVESGKLEEDWDLLPAKKIKDPSKPKPSDWVDEKEIDDPSDKKPEGYDDIAAQIRDPNASKPEDWDDEDDGKWEPPMIPNPDYKGEWKAKRIPNPAFKGEYVQPEIDNPEYSADDSLYLLKKPLKAVGFDLWQVKSGTIFNDILIADDIKDAETDFENTIKPLQEAEKAKKEAADKAKADEAKKAEEAKKEEKPEETGSEKKDEL